MMRIRPGIEFHSQHAEPVDRYLVNERIVVLLAGGHVDTLAALDEDAVTILAHQNHVEIPAHLVG